MRDPMRPKPLPKVVLCDIDGTVARRGERDPYDMTRVAEDDVNLPVAMTLNAYTLYGLPIIFISGRSETARADTEAWIDRHLPGVCPIGLHMRADGDIRKDAIVKRELYDANIHEQYEVVVVLDDRDQVVSLWRKELGLPCFQVAYGDF